MASPIAGERAVGGEKRLQEPAHRLELAAPAGRPQQRGRSARAAVEKHLDARRAQRDGSAEFARGPLAQGRQHALDVLAGAEPVHPVIDAAAGIGEGIEAAHLDLVEAAAAGLGTEAAEQRMARLQRLDGDDLGRAAPAPQRDLVLVAGAPAQERRPREHRPRLAGRTRLPGGRGRR